MSIKLDGIGSGFNRAKIDANFKKVEDYLNYIVLSRAATGVPGEATMYRDLDLNSFKILNAYVGETPLSDLGEKVKVIEDFIKNGAALYEGMLSFEEGNTLTRWNQALLWEATGDYYRWEGEFNKVVPLNSTPENSGGVGNGKWINIGNISTLEDSHRTKLLQIYFSELVTGRVNGDVDGAQIDQTRDPISGELVYTIPYLIAQAINDLANAYDMAWPYDNGNPVAAGMTEFLVPFAVDAVRSMSMGGVMQYEGLNFKYDPATRLVTLLNGATTLGGEVIVFHPSYREIGQILPNALQGFSFGTKFTLSSMNDHVYDPLTNSWYFWTGDYPKNVESAETPTGFNWVNISTSGYITPEMFGAKGDAILLHSTPLSSVIRGTTGITNPDATDNSPALIKMLAAQKATGLPIRFDGSKGYLVTKSHLIDYSNFVIDGCGATLVYRGGREPGMGNHSQYGVFHIAGTFDRYNKQAIPTSGTQALERTITVATATNKLTVGSYFLFYASNGVSSAEYETKVPTYAYYPVQVRRMVVDGANTTLYLDYAAGFTWTAAQIEMGICNPVENGLIKNFVLIDEMVVTETPDISPVPEAPTDEKMTAVSLVRGYCIANCTFENLRSYMAKYSTLDIFLSNNCNSKDIQTYFPKWWGGGEGYSVRLSQSIHSITDRPGMVGGRHVIDFTTCGHAAVNDAVLGSTNQVSFSLHTASEHDIVFNNCSGGSFYLENANYGLSCTRIKLKNCRFNVGVLNCVDLEIESSYFREVRGVFGRLNIHSGSVLNGVRYLDYNTKENVSAILGSYGVTGGITFSKDSTIVKLLNYSGFRFGGWPVALIMGTIRTLPGTGDVACYFVNVERLMSSAYYENTTIVSRGYFKTVNLTGTSAEFTFTATNRFYTTMLVDIPASVTASIILTGMQLVLNGTMRPFEIVTQADSLRGWKLSVAVGGSSFVNTLAGIVRDTNQVSPTLDIVGISSTKDAYDNEARVTDVAARKFPTVTG